MLKGSPYKTLKTTKTMTTKLMTMKTARVETTKTETTRTKTMTTKTTITTTTKRKFLGSSVLQIKIQNKIFKKS